MNEENADNDIPSDFPEEKFLGNHEINKTDTESMECNKNINVETKGDVAAGGNIDKSISFTVNVPEVIKNIKTEEQPSFVLENYHWALKDIKKNVEDYVKFEKYEKFIFDLQQNNIIIIIGKASIGKFTTALSLAADLENVFPPLQFYYIQPEPLIKTLSLLKFVNSKDFTDRSVLIFRDGFESHFSFCNELLLRSDDYYIQQLQGLLKERKSYIIITSESGIIENHRNLKDFVACVDLTTNQRKQILINAYHANIQKDERYEIARDFIEKNTELIIDRLSSPENIKIFVQDYLLKVLDNEKLIEVTLDEIRQPRSKIRKWFTSLPDDRCKYYAIILSLFDGLSWVDFQYVRSEIMKYVEPQQPNPQDETPKLIESQFYISDEELLENLQAKRYIKKITTEFGKTSIEIVEFKDRIFRDHFLDYVRRSHSSQLTGLLDPLSNLANNKNVEIRIKTALSVAEIGKIGFQLIEPLLSEWSQNDQPRVRATVGYTLAELVAEGKYEADVVRLLRFWANRNIKSRWTAASACKQIGFVDLEFGLRELKVVAENWRRNPDVYESIFYTLAVLSIQGNLNEILCNLNDWLNENSGEKAELKVLSAMAFIQLILAQLDVYGLDEKKMTNNPDEKISNVLSDLFKENKSAISNTMITIVQLDFHFIFPELRAVLKFNFQEVTFEIIRQLCRTNESNLDISVIIQICKSVYEQINNKNKRVFRGYLSRWSKSRYEKKWVKERFIDILRQLEG